MAESDISTFDMSKVKVLAVSMSGFSIVLVPDVQEMVKMAGTRRNAVLNILSMFQ